MKLALAVFILGAQSASGGLLVDLRFIPTEPLRDHAPEIGSLRLPAVGTVTDVREGERAVIGANQEKPASVVVRSSTLVEEFAQNGLESIVAAWAQSRPRNDSLILTARILRFQVIETNRYRGELELAFELSERGGVTVWKGTGSGTSSRFGRSLKPDNYSEAASDALKQVLVRVFSDSSFREALSGVRKEPVHEMAGPQMPSAARLTSAESARVELLKLLREGFDEDFLLGVVRKVIVVPPMTADEMIEWKRAGIPGPVIREAVSRSETPRLAVAPTPTPTPTAAPTSPPMKRSARDDL